MKRFISKKLAKKDKISLIILFGSQARKKTHPKSDVDIGVVFKDESIRFEKPVEIYGDLYEVCCKRAY